MTVPRQLELKVLEESVDVEVMFNGKKYTFDAATTPLFKMLNDASGISVNAFYARWQDEFEREDLQGFLSSLSVNGMIMID